MCSLVGTRKFQNLKIKTEISQENEIIQVAVAMNSIYVCICLLIGLSRLFFAPLRRWPEICLRPTKFPISRNFEKYL